MPASFTNKEQDVLNLLLNAETSLTASEMAARIAAFNGNTAQSVVRSLLKRGYIEAAQPLTAPMQPRPLLNSPEITVKIRIYSDAQPE